MKYREQLIKQLNDKLKITHAESLIEIPKDSSLGDYAFPCFTLAKELKKNPAQIAKELEGESFEGFTQKATGPYLNFTIHDSEFVSKIINKYEGIEQTQNPNIILIESPGPNTNKPLHLGHLRNMLLGDSLFTIMDKLGKKVHMVNVVNDRGVHICKSMIAYKKFGKGQTPDEAKRKPDHFVGDWYVRYAKELKNHPEMEQEVNEMLQQWEQGDKETLSLWKKMNDWAYKGWEETYAKLGFTIEKNYYESETYMGGKEIIFEGVNKGIFEKDDNGAIIVDLEKQKLGNKVLLRSNGTSVYITQDINMAQLRYNDYKFDEMIYIVGNEQEYHFKVLFEIFKLLDWPFGNKCKHFSYGMVELPSGKMKSREGTVVDTDDVLDTMREMAYGAVEERYPDLDEKEKQKRAEIIGNGAVRFFFLKYDSLRNFVFDPKESLSFEGETGPYVQYTHARICSIIRKTETTQGDTKCLQEPEEKELAKHISEFQQIVEKASVELKPNYICQYLIRLGQLFNSYYSKHKVIQEDKNLEGARIELLKTVKDVLKEGLSLLGIQAPERM